ncbi:uncharacterized protein N7477_005426 [Penicillium maclennaniae]|uniref:uncharacterized protein n=1 Tax=Penicillium maclennaniae TaxID=1343394 RepID=UPI00254037B8|nr:uncharacterized protein N7477_005426 [Penicillium maclennaniae]KAJ5670063.1 hypothetical protein N7477_005426 [Penicillium maclennaniae]
MFTSLSRRAQQREETHLQARGEAIAGVIQLHKLLHDFSPMNILPTQHNTLGIECKTFPIDQNSDDQSPSAPSDAFFRPRKVPPLDITNPTHQRQADYLSRCWGEDKQANRSLDLHSQTGNLWSRLGGLFVNFPRLEEPPRADGRSLRIISQWRSKDGIPEDMIAKKFLPDVLSSKDCSPIATYVAEKQFTPATNTAPHVFVVISLEEEPSDNLLRVELLTITSIMITRFEGEQFPRCIAIPVLAMSVFGRMKLRFLEAAYVQQRLVIRKTEFFDFSTHEQANKNMNTVLGFMASHRVGDPTNSTIIAQEPVLSDTKDIGKTCSVRKTFRKIFPSSGEAGTGLAIRKRPGATRGSIPKFD